MKYCYINGDKAKYTGKSEMLHGALCYEVIMIEGHMTGQIKHTYREPK